MKTRFQTLLSNFNLHRYAGVQPAPGAAAAGKGGEVFLRVFGNVYAKILARAAAGAGAGAGFVKFYVWDSDCTSDIKRAFSTL